MVGVLVFVFFTSQYVNAHTGILFYRLSRASSLLAPGTLLGPFKPPSLHPAPASIGTLLWRLFLGFPHYWECSSNAGAIPGSFICGVPTIAIADAVISSGLAHCHGCPRIGTCTFPCSLRGVVTICHPIASTPATVNTTRLLSSLFTPTLLYGQIASIKGFIVFVLSPLRSRLLHVTHLTEVVVRKVLSCTGSTCHLVGLAFNENLCSCSPQQCHTCSLPDLW